MKVATRLRAGLGPNANGLKVRSALKAGGFQLGNANGLKVRSALKAGQGPNANGLKVRSAVKAGAINGNALKVRR